MPSLSDTSISRNPCVLDAREHARPESWRSQSASKIASLSTAINLAMRSAAISRIRSGSCSACSVRAASTRNRAKPRSSRTAGPASVSGAISIGALSVSPRSRNTRTSRRWNHATGTTSSLGSASVASTTSGCARCGPTPYWTPRSAIAEAVALLSMPRATIRPPSRATNTTAAARCALATSLSCSRAATAGSRKTKSGRSSAIRRRSRVGDITLSIASRNPSSRSSRRRREPRVIDVGLRLALDHPGKLTRIDAVADGQCREIEVGRGQHLTRQGDEEHRGTGVLGERQRGGDRRGVRPGRTGVAAPHTPDRRGR